MLDSWRALPLRGRLLRVGTVRRRIAGAACSCRAGRSSSYKRRLIAKAAQRRAVLRRLHRFQPSRGAPMIRTALFAALLLGLSACYGGGSTYGPGLDS